MFGIIMAGGQGSRLMPLTQTRPKPMIEVLGRPVLEYVKDAMVEAGITNIVVTTGYRGEQLLDHVAGWCTGDETHAPLKARVNQESVPMGTAGSVGLLRDEITETCVVGSGDAVASFDIKALLEVHRKNEAKVTMALWEVDDPSPFGIVGLSNTPDGNVNGDLREGFIRQFLEKPSPEEAFSNVINAGLYILEPEVFEHIPIGEKYDFSKQLFPHLLSIGWPMFAKTIDGVWFDVGQPSELLIAQQTLMERYEELPFTYPVDSSVQGTSLVAMSASMSGKATSSVIGKHATVAQGAQVDGSILMDGCSVGRDAVVKNSVLGCDSVIGEGAIVISCVLGDGAHVEAHATVENERISGNS
jgi:mannose-1-phosphate guanylyltransferase